MYSSFSLTQITKLVCLQWGERYQFAHVLQGLNPRRCFSLACSISFRLGRYRSLSILQIKLLREQPTKTSFKNTSRTYSRVPSRICKSGCNLSCSLYESIAKRICRIQIQQFVIGLFTLNDDFNRFKTHLRDFLISLKEFAGDNTELYAEEREQAQRDAKAAERDRAMKVGGLLKPADMEQEDEL